MKKKPNTCTLFCSNCVSFSILQQKKVEFCIIPADSADSAVNAAMTPKIPPDAVII